MQPSWNILQAMLLCHYKAWRLSRSEDELNSIHHELFAPPDIISVKLPINDLTAKDKVVLTAFLQNQLQKNEKGQKRIIVVLLNEQTSIVKLKVDAVKAQRLFNDAQKIIDAENPPGFYKNTHCPECQFRDTCSLPVLMILATNLK